MSGNGHETRRVEDIIWREDLYPRFEPDPPTVQRYAESIKHLPPIAVFVRLILLTGGDCREE
jgi:hypothetical protein